MIATGPAMTLQVRDRDKVMEPHKLRCCARVLAPHRLCRLTLMPNRGRCELAYLCAGLYAPNGRDDRQFSIVIRIGARRTIREWPSAVSRARAGACRLPSCAYLAGLQAIRHQERLRFYVNATDRARWPNSSLQFRLGLPALVGQFPAPGTPACRARLPGPRQRGPSGCPRCP